MIIMVAKTVVAIIITTTTGITIMIVSLLLSSFNWLSISVVGEEVDVVGAKN